MKHMKQLLLIQIKLHQLVFLYNSCSKCSDEDLWLVYSYPYLMKSVVLSKARCDRLLLTELIWNKTNKTRPNHIQRSF